MTNTTRQTSRQKFDKPTTLSSDYRCDDCGEPAMVYVGNLFYCPKCYLKKEGQRILPLDHAGFYP